MNHFLFPPALLLLFSSLPLFAQGTVTEEMKQLDQWVEKTDANLQSLKKFEVDVSGIDANSGFGQLVGYLNAEDRMVAVGNKMVNESGGVFTKHWYFDDHGHLAVSREVSTDPLEGGALNFDSETSYFKNLAVHALVSQNGEIPAGARPDPRRFEKFITPGSEIGENGAAEHYNYQFETAVLAESLLRGLSGKNGELPRNILLNSISPDGRFIVQWNVLDKAEMSATYHLLNLSTGKQVLEVGSGLQPDANHVYQWAKWSPGSMRVIFGADAKWTTIDAVTPRTGADGSAVVVGDVFKAATDYAWNQLKAAGHPYTETGEGIMGFVQVISVDDNGKVHLILSTESKIQDMLRSEMTLLFKQDQETKGAGFDLLDPEATPGVAAELSSGGRPETMPAKPLPVAKPIVAKPIVAKKITISGKKFGPITAETPFDLKAVRALFPDFDVKATTEYFEEGDEQPVIQVFDGEDRLLMIVPIVDKAELGYISTNSPAVATQLGFAAGDLFGDIFQKTPSHAFFEGLTGDVVTEDPGVPNVMFRFEPSVRDDEIGELPDYEKLKSWKLYAIEWQPENGGE